MYDLIIIGAGPGGYIAAERAGHLGKKVLLIEKEHLGGVCLNKGCIPTKTLLACSKHYKIAKSSEAFGVTADSVSFSLEKAMERKQGVIEGLRKGIASLMKKFKVEVVTGEAEFVSAKEVKVGEETYTGENIIIATGSSPAKPPIKGADLPIVLDSTAMLNLEKLPENPVIIGGGVIGLEFACFLATLGIKTTVIEMADEVCPGIDKDIAKILRTELKKKGVKTLTSSMVTEITESSVKYKKKDKDQEVEADLVLLSTGRTLNLEGFGLDKTGVDFDKAGIKINDKCKTNVPGIWAIGDCTGKALLAHIASRQAECCVHNMYQDGDKMRYNAIPGVIYTSPEVATVGLTEEQAKEQGKEIIVANIPMGINGRFIAENDGTRGTAKVIVDANSKVLLGVHMIGSSCSEMIFGATAMIETEMRVKEITEIIFPHPTVSEVLKDSLYSLR